MCLPVWAWQHNNYTTFCYETSDVSFCYWVKSVFCWVFLPTFCLALNKQSFTFLLYLCGNETGSVFCCSLQQVNYVRTFRIYTCGCTQQCSVLLHQPKRQNKIQEWLNNENAFVWFFPFCTCSDLASVSIALHVTVKQYQLLCLYFVFFRPTVGDY